MIACDRAAFVPTAKKFPLKSDNPWLCVCYAYGMVIVARIKLFDSALVISFNIANGGLRDCDSWRFTRVLAYFSNLYSYCGPVL